MRLVVLMCLVQAVWVTHLEIGDMCTGNNGLRGVCKSIAKCADAIPMIKKRIFPINCGFESKTIPIICCVPPKSSKRTTTTTTTTEYTPEEEDYEDLHETNNYCKPIDDILVNNTDSTAWKKCVQYRQELVYPSVTAELGRMIREKNCKHSATKLVYGGVNADEREFPHMVMLSYSEDIKEFKSECGGSVISDWFILTAAHCIYKRNVGNVQYAATGALKQSNIQRSRIYKIAERVPHESYDSLHSYYDIALLKTETKIKLDKFVIPACLDTGNDLDLNEALVTGWGTYIYGEPAANHLQKAVLQKFSDRECSTTFNGELKLPRGVNLSIQFCYGDKVESKDACSGDSGGPLQLKMQRAKCMYSIIGVTSFGVGCGTIGRPGVYTRVIPFVSWIEKIVWPNE